MVPIMKNVSKLNKNTSMKLSTAAVVLLSALGVSTRLLMQQMFLLVLVLELKRLRQVSQKILLLVSMLELMKIILMFQLVELLQ